MKNYFTLIAIVAFMVLVGIMIGLKASLDKYKSLYAKELNNVSAYQNMNQALQQQQEQFTYTIDQLKRSKDTLDQKINRVLKEVKTKDVQQVHYIESVIQKTDTINYRDTIFQKVEPVDTLVGNEWYSIALRLQYPSTINITPKFISEKYVVVDNKRRIPNPSKLFFIRWFQKKYNYTTIEVVEKNPYIQNTQTKFIKITK